MMYSIMDAFNISMEFRYCNVPLQITYIFVTTGYAEKLMK